MIYGSVCSGIEAASVAFAPLGWHPAFFAEIEPFPSRVLREHFPDVPNYGDITKFQDWPHHEIDLLIGGTPCQSYSISGQRAGLADPRGNLMLCYAALAAKYRPRWLIWENVPGVLSSNGGRDFAALLSALAECGYCCAWRVLDARHYGLPQMRRRVWLVAHLGDWRPAAEVLFERESLRGDSAPRREAQKTVAGTLKPSIAAKSRFGNIEAACAESVMPGAPADNEIDYYMRRVAHGAYAESDYASTQLAGQSSNDKTDLVVSGRPAEGKVRRIMPVECERLMGFPDGWTALPGGGATQRAIKHWATAWRSMWCAGLAGALTK